MSSTVRDLLTDAPSHG